MNELKYSNDEEYLPERLPENMLASVDLNQEIVNRCDGK